MRHVSRRSNLNVANTIPKRRIHRAVSMPIISRFNDVSASDYWIGYQEKKREREWSQRSLSCTEKSRVNVLTTERRPWGSAIVLEKMKDRSKLPAGTLLPTLLKILLLSSLQLRLPFTGARASHTHIHVVESLHLLEFSCVFSTKF